MNCEVGDLSPIPLEKGVKRELWILVAPYGVVYYHLLPIFPFNVIIIDESIFLNSSKSVNNDL